MLRMQTSSYSSVSRPFIWITSAAKSCVEKYQSQGRAPATQGQYREREILAVNLCCPETKIGHKAVGTKQGSMSVQLAEHPNNAARLHYQDMSTVYCQLLEEHALGFVTKAVYKAYSTRTAKASTRLELSWPHEKGNVYLSKPAVLNTSVCRVKPAKLYFILLP